MNTRFFRNLIFLMEKKDKIPANKSYQHQNKKRISKKKFKKEKFQQLKIVSLNKISI